MESQKCAVCEEATSRYMCPRCSVPYCSVDCYKRHGDCSREFEEEHFREEMSSVSADLDTQNMMKDILVKLHRQDIIEDQELGDDFDLIDRIDDIDEVVPGVANERLEALARGELQPDDLDDAEMHALHKSMMSDIYVDPWTPWWESEEVRDVQLAATGTRLVQAVEHVGIETYESSEGRKMDNEYESNVQRIPMGPREPILPLSRLTSKPPSDVILLFVIDVLFWYCLVLRMFNGDIELCGEELVRVLVKHGVSISTGAATLTRSFRSAQVSGSGGDIWEFAESLLDTCESADFFSGPAESGVAVGVLNDVASLFSLRRTGILLALSDILDASAAIKKQKNTALVRQATVVERKLVYFLSWANERANAMGSWVSSELVEVYKKKMDIVQCLHNEGDADEAEELIIHH